MNDVRYIEHPPDSKALADYADRLAPGYEAMVGDVPDQIRAGQRLVDQLPAGSRVLDIGSGTGRPTAEQLVAAGMDVVGIDISSGMLDIARKQLPAAEFRKLDVLDLDEADLGQFDAAIAFFSLLALPADYLREALRKVHRRLVPGGRLVLGMNEHHDNNLVERFGRKYTPTVCTFGTLDRDARAAGFTVDSIVREQVEPLPHLFLHAHR
ncbi:Ubiquinone/menaquinone biosynthesis C-methylase UbiE [Saccharopolyspora kobensis]|uniref:Ubiquinone/menaquinone biosynthesis C-methylase UbiE n=1 Tax=Saccharopolyspora kobensis TaxID=146035 RepID=A0A1H5XCA9_9PSEU|nr:class I SAM-dependent methyltransferase [Saccharopolyspora kobensis]SEG08846.1 Ubiquinone/menaquinone biosynthesis C-methylase UbiE [Saccharopolyspora kobensis]SFE45245.1 Ubiquinone/menaquinone biosynthesis C-methylase UbiE [Saccharopolyspora kobensis]